MGRIYLTLGSVAWMLAAGQLYGQMNDNPYLFPAFDTATLYYSETPSQRANLNYHKVSEEMVLKMKNFSVPINDIETVDSIRLQNRTFFKIDGKFYELLVNAEYQLVRQHRATAQPTAKEGAYGVKSQTSAVQTIELQATKPHEFYDMRWPKQEIVDRSEFLLHRAGTWYKAESLGQIAKVFPEKRKAMRKFAAERRLDLGNPVHLSGLIRFCLE